MKKIVLMLVLGTLFFNAAHAQKYFGKSYKKTTRVDEYFDDADVKNPYTVMGKAELDQGFRSLEKCQRKIVDLAKDKGADGVIFFLEEEVYGTSNSSSATVNEKKKNKTTAYSSSNSVDLKQKVIRAKFIKYN